MKSYQSHKRVEAAKIVAADLLIATGAAVLKFEDDTTHTVSNAWLGKHGEPEHLIGGYFVRYPGDGYTSWSPAKAFEEGYSEVRSGELDQLGEPAAKAENLCFGAALAWLKVGARVARAGWNGKGMWIVLVPGTPNAQLREGTPYREATGLEECEILPHIDMWTTNAHGRRAMLCGWVASQTDLLSDDWCVVDEHWTRVD